jgi:hypothetical protein
VASTTARVPAERLEEGIEEPGADLIFFVVAGDEDLAVAGEPLDEVSHQCGRRSSHSGNRIDVRTPESRWCLTDEVRS